MSILLRSYFSHAATVDFVAATNRRLPRSCSCLVCAAQGGDRFQRPFVLPVRHPKYHLFDSPFRQWVFPSELDPTRQHDLASVEGVRPRSTGLRQSASEHELAGGMVHPLA